MKTTKILAILALALGLVICPVNDNTVAAMGTAFTYQGRLIDADLPADGLFDFQFKLYDSNDLVTGIQLGSTIDVSGVEAIDGFITTKLDFASAGDPGAFDCNTVWLEIAVRPKTIPVGSFTTLTPRQEVTPTPFAMVAGATCLGGSGGGGGDADWIYQGTGNMIAWHSTDNVGIGVPLVPLAPLLAKLEVRGKLGQDGVLVTGAGANGIVVNNTVVNGVLVDGSTKPIGGDGVQIIEPALNGVNIQGSGFNGLLVDGTNAGKPIGLDGVAVLKPNRNGVLVRGAGMNGVEVDGSIDVIAGDGVFVVSPNGHGVHVQLLSNPANNLKDGVHSETEGSGKGVFGKSKDGTGVLGKSESTVSSNAGVYAIGNGADSPGTPRAAALKISNGAITVSGQSRPVGTYSIDPTAAWTEFEDYDAVCSDGSCIHQHQIGWFIDINIPNDLIVLDNSILFLTVQADGGRAFASVHRVLAGAADVRVTFVGWRAVAPTDVRVNYLIINSLVGEGTGGTG